MINADIHSLVFGKNGWLSRNGFDDNPVQQDYAKAVLSASRNGFGKICPIEAETGVGKTLGYLFHLCATASLSKRVVIATHTVALLKQIEADIEIIKSCFNDLDIPFPLHCIRLGREHYINPHKVSNIINEMAEDKNQTVSDAHIEFLNWSQKTVISGSGLINEWESDFGHLPDGIVHSRICCDAMTNLDVNMKMEDTVSISKVASLVVTTHAMLVNHILIGTLGTLEKAIILLDEADKFEDAARLILNKRIPFIYTQKLIQKYASYFKNSSQFKPAIDAITELDEISGSVIDKSDSRINLLRHLPLCEREAIQLNAKKISEYISIGINTSSANIIKSHASDSQFIEIESDIKLMSEGYLAYSKSDFNRGIAQSDILAQNSLFIRNAKPAAVINRLIELNCCVIFTSATIQNTDVQGHKSYSALSSTTLIPEHSFYNPCSFTPANFGDIDFVLTDKKTPRPYINGSPSKIWLNHVAETILTAASKHNRVLVLCSSYVDIERFESIIRDAYPVHSMTRKSKQKTVIANWKEMGGICLSANAWEGFSLREDDGSQLFTGLVITKLPYQPIDDLEISALQNYFLSIGKTADMANGAYHKAINHRAICKFRQGVGRLIRKRTDKGTIYITDPRFCMPGDRYKGFIKAIPDRFQSKIQLATYSNGEAFTAPSQQIIEGLI